MKRWTLLLLLAGCGGAEHAVAPVRVISMTANQPAPDLRDIAAGTPGCARLRSCVIDLAALLCVSTDAGCRGPLMALADGEAEGDGCRSGWARLPALMQEAARSRPTFMPPEACRDSAAR